ncbi:MAG: hypothetical protein WDW36_008355 [Sanguina aurantia]
MQADECGAAVAVLRYFYSMQLKLEGRDSCSAELLLQMMKVADRWQAPQALAALSSVLCKLQLGDFPTAAVYALPLGLQTSPAFAAVKAQAAVCLDHVFGDAAATAATPTLVAAFLLLPQAAVRALLQSETLSTDAEATVLLLLSEWCQGEFGQACTTEELQQLNVSIRYSHLSISYLTELCESLHSPALTSKQRMELLYFRAIPGPAQEKCAELGSLCNPDGWYLPARPKPAKNDGSTLTLTLELSEVEICKLAKSIQLGKDGGPRAASVQHAHSISRTLAAALPAGFPAMTAAQAGMSTLASATALQQLHSLHASLGLGGETPTPHTRSHASKRTGESLQSSSSASSSSSSSKRDSGSSSSSSSNSERDSGKSSSSSSSATSVGERDSGSSSSSSASGMPAQVQGASGAALRGAQEVRSLLAACTRRLVSGWLSRQDTLLPRASLTDLSRLSQALQQQQQQQQRESGDTEVATHALVTAIMSSATSLLRSSTPRAGQALPGAGAPPASFQGEVAAVTALLLAVARWRRSDAGPLCDAAARWVTAAQVRPQAHRMQLGWGGRRLLHTHVPVRHSNPA